MIPSGRPLLSIAIPTYNRPEQLACLLDSILYQYLPGMSLEIFVSDNSNDNRTSDLIEKYKRFLPIAYIQHQRNIGGCRNFIYSVGASNGAYCWIVGDDDLIAQGSITSILMSLVLFAVTLISKRIAGLESLLNCVSLTRLITMPQILAISILMVWLRNGKTRFF
jgi:glycosyltransferase involved in cell wall biosynthesis